MNIKFSYMYRDYGNYKNHNEVVLANSTNISAQQVEKVIKNHLIDGEWFYASDWKVPDLHFEDWVTELDSPVHEFVKVEETNETSNIGFNLEQFLIIINNAKNSWII